MRVLSGASLLRQHPSDTVFVLAPGASVNSLTNKQWEHIRLHTSIAINYWTVHPFDPDLHLVELSRTPGPLQEIQLRNLELLRGRFSRADAGPQYLVKANPRVVDHAERLAAAGIDAVETSGLFTKSDQSMRSQLRRLLRRRRPLRRLCTLSSSVDTAVLLGMMSGFSRVVLIGVDLSDSYFFEEPGRMRTDVNVHIPDPYPAHTTQSTAHRPPWLVLSNVLAACAGSSVTCSLYTGTPCPPLAPHIPEYLWPDE